jgi:ApbE superfamily uncharacterized protein (UPF0280 family)
MEMSGAAVRLLPDGRLHLQHGPIDLIIEAWGEQAEVAAAYDQAAVAFAPVLDGLVTELPVLRRSVREDPLGQAPPLVTSPVARRMVAAAWRHRAVFITPMAAVAGAVADHVLAAMLAGRSIERAYVNDGGDIALHLARGQALTLGAVTRLDRPAIDAAVRITAGMPVRGVATSGQGGRSFSFGIADAVTVLADDAAAADAAATLIANAVTIDLPAIRRAPANSIDIDSDLGDRAVVVDVGPLTDDEVTRALRAGRAEAERMRRAGLIFAAFLALRCRYAVAGPPVLALARPGGVPAEELAR